ncbi:STAS domain-containing protein [Spongiactinospora sp. TRM90649]|uniref:STAS domain-containing protein n=1 Tax=Spongiactinospora sp. TRM90649 TaxID=3031114 RepID=UPI0023F9D076|nr:STAS domain-containing protein [Spongiactinospora sp. TRM90649]MDF5755185.1 STAS domain-containing protein [Spongiactinospora sp. TRM90649]
MENFTVDIDWHGTAVVIRLSGELDLATAPTLRDCLGVALAEFGSPTLVVDTGGLTFCDSSGLSVLLSGLSLAESAGGSLALSAVGGQLARLLAVTGLNARFQIFTTTPEALDRME